MRCWLFVVAVLILYVPVATAAEKPVVLELWSGKAPSESAEIEAEKVLDAKPNEQPPTQRITNVSRPTIAVYRPAADKNTGTAIVIAPGGGYSILAYDKEGVEVAQWASSIGVTGIVLKYRVPRRADQPKGQPPLQPLQDAQRAVSMVRNQASEWGIDPKRIGFLGFSAGGNLAANLATHNDKPAYDAQDAVSAVSCRPDFAVLVYAGSLIDKQTGKLLPEFPVTKQTPPMIMIHAANDHPETSIAMFQALQAVGVPAELHVYSTGGHGFGMRVTENPCHSWPERCADWLRMQGMLATNK